MDQKTRKLDWVKDIEIDDLLTGTTRFRKTGGVTVEVNGRARQMELFEIEEIRTEIKKGPEFYTLQEAADMLKVHYITVYRLVVIGEVAASQVAGCWRITATALQAYLEKRHPFNMDDKF